MTDLRSIFWSGFLAAMLIAACTAPTPTPLDYCGPRPYSPPPATQPYSPNDKPGISDNDIRVDPFAQWSSPVEQWESCIEKYGGTP